MYVRRTPSGPDAADVTFILPSNREYEIATAIQYTYLRFGTAGLGPLSTICQFDYEGSLVEPVDDGMDYGSWESYEE